MIVQLRVKHAKLAVWRALSRSFLRPPPLRLVECAVVDCGVECGGAAARAHVPRACAARARAHARRARRLLQQIETMRLDPANVGLNFRELQEKLFQTGLVQDYLDAFFPDVIDERDVRRPPAHFLLAG